MRTKIISAETLRLSRDFFKVLHTTGKSQTAVMTLAKGEVSGEFGTDHPHSDQILYVLSGAVEARIEERSERLESGDLIIIPAGAEHQTIGDSEEPAQTLNIYAPVAYPDEE